MSANEPRPLPSTGSEAGPRAPKFIVIALLSLAIGSAVFLLRREALPLPDVDLSRIEPRAAERIRERQEQVELHPRSPEAWGNLGMTLHSERLVLEAAESYERAIELEPADFRWHYLRAHALAELDPERALEALDRALAIDPDYAAAYILQARLLEERGETGSARALYEKALELEPRSAAAAFGAGRLSLEEGDLEKARELLEQAAGHDNAAPIHEALADLYRRLGDEDRARREEALAEQAEKEIEPLDPIYLQMQEASKSSARRERREIAPVESLLRRDVSPGMSLGTKWS